MNLIWAELARRAGNSLDEKQQFSLSRYLDLLFSANERMNLTRITDRAAAEVLHVADALTLLPFLPKRAHRLADVGSGGGVPGIVLAIARPDAQIVLIESTRKKAEFLRAAALELGLANVSVDARRAEDAGRTDLRQSFDVAVARAVATMPWLAEWLLPLVKIGGVALAMKGPRVREELSGAQHAIGLLGGEAPTVESITLSDSAQPQAPENPSGLENHVILRIKKIARTPSRYPRSSTETKGEPLA